MDPKLIKSTQDNLGKIIKKPPLTDKLLSKPPFRFLHDIITSVIKTTGFMKGLYADGELNSENVKDKDSKMAFLQKAVDMVSLVVGKQLSVRPSKVVAGHEPEKTNEFLVALATAVNMKVNNDEFVQRVLKGDKGGKDSKPAEEKKDKERERTRDKEPEKEEKKSRDSSDRRKEEKESRDKDKEDRKDKDDRREKSKDRSRDKDRGRDEKDRNGEKDRVKDRDREKDKDRQKEKDKDREHRDRDKERDQKSRKEESAQSAYPSTSTADRKSGIKSRLKVRPAEESLESIIKPGQKGPDPRTGRKGSTTQAAERKDSVTKTDRRGGFTQSSQRSQDRKASVPAANSTDKGAKKSTLPQQSKGSLRGQINDVSPAQIRGSAAQKSGSPSQGSKLISKQRKSSFTMLVQEDSEAEGTDQPASRKIERPTSAKGSRRRRDEDIPANHLKQETGGGGGTLGEDDLPPQVAEARKLARPSSARPAAPRVKNKDAVTEEPSMRLGSGKPTNVIVDNEQSDDEDNFMVEESAPPPMTIEREKTMRGGLENDDGEEHGGLVKKILETKKELEGGNQPVPQQKKTEIERPTMSDAARRKEREMVQKEIDKLRNSIQTLTRSANPLGKVMDYVQEDLDAMQKELEMWKKENKEHTLALRREQSITDKAIEPLKAQLSEIDQAIVDQMDLIAAVKSNIIHNDQKVEKMLRSISKS